MSASALSDAVLRLCPPDKAAGLRELWAELCDRRAPKLNLEWTGKHARRLLVPHSLLQAAVRACCRERSGEAPLHTSARASRVAALADSQRNRVHLAPRSLGLVVMRQARR